MSVRIVAICLTTYVTLIRPPCTIMTMPSIHKIFFDQQSYYCPWYQTVFAYATASYLWELFTSFFVQERRKDFHVLLVHHLATIFCLLVANCMRSYEIGMLVLLSHDISDPFLEVSRIAMCLQEDRKGQVNIRLRSATDIVAPFLLVAWVAGRLCIFPLRGIYAAATVDRSCGFYYQYFVVMSLSLLAVLNFMWSLMLTRGILNRLVLGMYTDEVFEDPDPVAVQEKVAAAEGREKIN
jgi:ceramide synthetase